MKIYTKIPDTDMNMAKQIFYNCSRYEIFWKAKLK